MKVLKHRNLLGCLFAVILAMPLINIGVRCGYVIWNKNAKDSYSGYSDTNYINYQPIDTYNDMEVGKMYNLNTDNKTYVGTSSINLYVNDLEVIYKPSSTDISLTRLIRITYYTNSNYFRFYFYDVNNTQLANFIIYNQDSNLNLNFRFESCNPINEFDNFKQLISTYEYVQGNNTLDNAFDYSISKITESNNIGELKFFTWFADLFLDLDNSSNALYINFINWYFNYALLVSAVYILFLALMWFIQWVRRLLERGMDFGNRSW